LIVSFGPLLSPLPCEESFGAPCLWGSLHLKKFPPFPTRSLKIREGFFLEGSYPSNSSSAPPPIWTVEIQSLSLFRWGFKRTARTILFLPGQMAPFPDSKTPFSHVLGSILKRGLRPLSILLNFLPRTNGRERADYTGWSSPSPRDLVIPQRRLVFASGLPLPPRSPDLKDPAVTAPP